MPLDWFQHPILKFRKRDHSILSGNIIFKCSHCEDGYFKFNQNIHQNSWIENNGSEEYPGLVVIPIICNNCRYSSVIEINILIPLLKENI